MQYFLGVIIGAIMGVIISWLFSKIRGISGTLKIDHSNPEKDVYRIELDNLDVLSKKYRVVLKVDHNAKLTQD